MSEKLHNPLIHLAGIIHAQAAPDTSPIPSPEAIAKTANETIHPRDVERKLKLHFSYQRQDAQIGKCEQYRPEEPEAQNVPIHTEVMGFVRDFSFYTENRLKKIMTKKIENGEKNTHGEIAAFFLKLASESDSFRSAGAYKFITAIELAEHFDPNIKYRLGQQLADEARKNTPELSPEEASRIVRSTVGLIDGIATGKISIHPQEHDQANNGTHTGRIARESEDRRSLG